MCVCPSGRETLHPSQKAAGPFGVQAVPYLWVEDTAWDRSLWTQCICFSEALQILIRGREKSPQARASSEARKAGAGEAALPSCGASVPQVRWAV